MNKLALVVLATSLAFAASASAQRVIIVSEQDVAKSWSVSPETAGFVAAYPAAVPDKSQDVCVNLGFMINADGSTSNYTLVKAWSSATADDQAVLRVTEPFVQNVAAVVQRRKFVPAAKPRMVYTSVTMAFRGGQAGAEEIRAHCLVADLEKFVADAARTKRQRQAQQAETRRDMQSASRY